MNDTLVLSVWISVATHCTHWLNESVILNAYSVKLIISTPLQGCIKTSQVTWGKSEQTVCENYLQKFLHCIIHKLSMHAFKCQNSSSQFIQMKTTGRMKYPALRQVLVLQADGMCEDVKFMSLHFSVFSLLRRHWHSVHELPTVVHITLSCVTLSFPTSMLRERLWGEDSVVDWFCITLIKNYKPKQRVRTVLLCLFAVGRFNWAFRKVVFRNAVWGRNAPVCWRR